MTPGRTWLAAALIIAVAAILRLYGIGAQSLWYDEGTSAVLAQRSMIDIAASARADIHPPLYYWLLALWGRVVGFDPVALRTLSALAGTLTVAALIWIVASITRPAFGLAAGVAAAGSPYLVWYSQEVRAYIFTALLAVVLAAMGWRSGDGGRHSRLWWAACWAAVTAALYTHYFAGVVAIAVGNAGFLASGMRHPRALSATPNGAANTSPVAALRPWAVCQVAAVLAFLPWLALAWPAITSWPAVGPDLPADELAREAARLLAVGTGPAPGWASRVFAVWAVLGAVAMGARNRRWGPRAAGLMLAWAAAAPVGLWLLAMDRPAWNPKFLAPSAPGFEALLGAGLAVPGVWIASVVARRVATTNTWAAPAAGGLAFAVAATTVLVPRAGSLRAMAHEPAYQRDDYRGLVGTVVKEADATDAVILNAPTQIEVYDYYMRGPGGASGGRVTPPATYPLPASRPPDRASTEQALAAITARHEDVFGVLWATSESDPEDIVQTWLDRHRFKAFDRWFGGVRLVLWGAERPLTSALSRPVRFDDTVDLHALAIGPRTVDAGDVLIVEARWRPAAASGTDYVVFLQLLDEAGRMVAGRDLAPGSGRESTAAWRPGLPAEVVDRIGLHLPADLSPGKFNAILGIYDAATGRRAIPVLRAANDDVTAAHAGIVVGVDSIHLGTIAVVDPTESK